MQRCPAQLGGPIRRGLGGKQPESDRALPGRRRVVKRRPAVAIGGADLDRRGEQRLDRAGAARGGGAHQRRAARVGGQVAVGARRQQVPQVRRPPPDRRGVHQRQTQLVRGVEIGPRGGEGGLRRTLPTVEGDEESPRGEEAVRIGAAVQEHAHHLGGVLFRRERQQTAGRDAAGEERLDRPRISRRRRNDRLRPLLRRRHRLRRRAPRGRAPTGRAPGEGQEEGGPGRRPRAHLRSARSPGQESGR